MFNKYLLVKINNESINPKTIWTFAPEPPCLSSWVPVWAAVWHGLGTGRWVWQVNQGRKYELEKNMTVVIQWGGSKRSRKISSDSSDMWYFLEQLTIFHWSKTALTNSHNAWGPRQSRTESEPVGWEGGRTESSKTFHVGAWDPRKYVFPPVASEQSMAACLTASSPS
jgi:hypothetical protein